MPYYQFVPIWLSFLTIHEIWIFSFDLYQTFLFDWHDIILLLAGTVDNAEWSCWTEWSPCTLTCGGSGHRQRKRSCIPGTANAGSQDVTCLGNNFERDKTCGSSLPCPDAHCPDGYQYSKEYVLIISKAHNFSLFGRNRDLKYIITFGYYRNRLQHLLNPVYRC